MLPLSKMSFVRNFIPVFLAALGLSLPSGATAAGSPTKIVFLGDSLTEGYGISRTAAFPHRVGEKLKAKGHDVEVINAGISGSTTASAVSRVKWILKGKPDLLVLALGGNDGLRGLSLKKMKQNLSDAIDLAEKKHVPVLLAGMKIPPNYGKQYTRDFEKAFSELAREKRVALIPFLLEGVGGERDLNLPDGIHPNEKGHEKMADTVLKHLLPLLPERS